ncbi:MAG: tripartite tricarboxylate transporter substrate-binding protein [Xanthobacteraceae bacterium]
MRAAVRNLGFACALLGSITSAAAQSWPSHAITLTVPFGPGSGSDTVARIIAGRVAEILRQPVIVENLGGAGGTIAVSRAAKAAPDGYLVVLGAVDTFAQSQSLFKVPPYDAAADFMPVALAVEQPLILITRTGIPARNLQEFAAYLKTNQEKMQFGSTGVGSGPYLACFLLNSAIGVKVTSVPYRSSAPAFTDMMAGTLDYYCPLAVGAIPFIDNKQVNALAILTAQRSSLLPDLPTAKEQGFDVVDGYYWMGFFVPKGTPEPIVTKLNAAIVAALDTPAVQDRLRVVATTVVASERRTPAYLKAFLASEIAKWRATMEASGVTPQ